MQKPWFKIALFNFLIAACIGALLRFAFVEEVTWLTFKYWLHGHSHVAMLGWVYLGLYALLIHVFLPEDKQRSAFYNIVFWLTQLSVIGMMVAFPMQGYASFSIAFSSLHILLSYLFVWRFWRDVSLRSQVVGVRSEESGGRSQVVGVFAVRFVRAALLFMVLSTVAIWAIPIIVASGQAGSALYYGAVQFFLHFQFNGWFIFAVLALFLKLLEQHNHSMPSKLMKVFFLLLVISCFLTFALAVTWSTPLPFLFLINSIGVSIQLAAVIVFILLVKKTWKHLAVKLEYWVRVLMGIAFASFVLKILIQTAVVIPYIATIGYTIRNFTIGFIHLMLLGMITCFLLAYGAHHKFLNFNTTKMKIALLLFLIGFGLSEAILFLQGTMFWGAMGFMPYYYELLFGVSLLLPLGVGSLLVFDKKAVADL